MSRKKSYKHIDDIRAEVVERISTTSNQVIITRAWEIITGNVAHHCCGQDDKMIEVSIYNGLEGK
jgi:hypothetical protein